MEGVFIGKISEMYVGLTEDEIVQKMQELQNIVEKEGYTLASGEDGKYDEIWKIPIPIMHDGRIIRQGKKNEKN
jgi:hypothetical protein